MLTLHHLNNSRSQRVLWFLEELGLEYQVTRYERDTETLAAPASLAKVHPLGMAPILEDGDLTIAETGAIVDYLLEVYAEGRFTYPAGSQERRDMVFWTHYAEGTLMSFLLLKLVMVRMKAAPAPFFVQPIKAAIAEKVTESAVTPRLDRHLDFVESKLEGRSFLAGDALSVADIMMSFPLEAGAARAEATGGRPNIKAYLARLQAREAYGRALQKGGPYEIVA